MPPTITAHFTPMLDPKCNEKTLIFMATDFRQRYSPKASVCSDIWKASSLVGVRTSAKYLWGFSSNACSMGMIKAPVFPDPVSAKPIMSLPCRAIGMASLCILVGVFHFNDSHVSHNTSVTPCTADKFGDFRFNTRARVDGDGRITHQVFKRDVGFFRAVDVLGFFVAHCAGFFSSRQSEKDGRPPQQRARKPARTSSSLVYRVVVRCIAYQRVDDDVRRSAVVPLAVGVLELSRSRWLTCHIVRPT